MAFRSRGLPSTGCNKCRSRKMRCDEAKPICENCLKIRHADCKYRDEFERTWRNQTNKTVEQTHAKQRINIKATPPESQTLCRFFYDWAIEADPAPGISISWFNSLPTMYANAVPKGLLHTSIRALANANYGKRFNHPDALSEGARLCGEALRMLRSTLFSNVHVARCEILASVVLLGIYEAIIDQSIANNGTWMNHMGGASVLFNVQRPEESMVSPLELQISTMIFRQMLHGSLIAGRAPAIPVEQAKTLGLPPLEHIYAQTALIYEATMLCAEWKTAFENIDVFSSWQELSNISVRAMSLDKKLDQWSKALPQTFAYSIKPATSDLHPEWLQKLLGGSWTPHSSHIYASPVIEMLWRFYWETRMILSQALLYTNSVLEDKDSPSNPIANWRKEIESCLIMTADHLCESCISPLAAVGRKGSECSRTEHVTSLHGYLMLQILPTVGLCLDQVAISDVDLSGRKEWVNRMKRFLVLHLGFSKAAAEIDPKRFSKLPIQIWGLTA